MNSSKVRAIAFYLPQFYPTRENDEWWGTNFTEWTNVKAATPVFKGHIQPKVPGELGYYDLRDINIRRKQAELAREAGIEGFCYWHYWFAGQRLLDRVFKEVVENRDPDYPFCLCWANHSWYKKTWNPNVPDQLLIEQTYPGVEDYINHFNEMLPAFKDERYIRTDDEKLVFSIYAPLDFDDFPLFKETWNNLAIEHGLNGFHFIGLTYKKQFIDDILSKGYDAVMYDAIMQTSLDRNKFVDMILKVRRDLFNYPYRRSKYDDYVRCALDNIHPTSKVHAIINPNFDHSPRSRQKGIILTESTPEKWGALLKKIIEKGTSRKDNFVFLKAWNEWGEGNYLEPDKEYGRQYLNETGIVIKSFNNTNKKSNV